MTEAPARSRLRRAGGAALKFLFPFSAIRQTATLARREADRTRANMIVLKDLGKSAREAVAGPPSTERRDEAFDTAISRRRPNAMNTVDLRKHFLWRKRIALFAAALFFSSALLQVIAGAWSHSIRAIVLGAVCGIGFQPMFFVIALSAQLRIWQLDTHRLSASERGGLRDFVRECPKWWRVTLNPEIRLTLKDDA